MAVRGLTISRKFFAVLAVLAPLMLALALISVLGLGSMKSAIVQVFADNIHTSQVSTTLGADLAHADVIALQLAGATAPAERRALDATLDENVVPTVDAGLAELQALHAHDPPAERVRVQQLQRGWSQFLALRRTAALDPERSPAGVRKVDRLATQIAGIFAPLQAITQGEAGQEAAAAAHAHASATASYHTSLRLIWAIAAAAFVLGIGSVLLLTRNVVPLIRRYSEFATAVAGGDPDRQARFPRLGRARGARPGARRDGRASGC